MRLSVICFLRTWTPLWARMGQGHGYGYGHGYGQGHGYGYGHDCGHGHGQGHGHGCGRMDAFHLTYKLIVHYTDVLIRTCTI